MNTKLVISLLLLLCLQSGFSQDKLLTVAEKSDYKSIFEHKDVIEFINNLKKSSEYIRIESIGTSPEGRDIPLLIIGNPLPASPESIKEDERIVVYIQGNIHAGEVEGKEASLMFARDILNPDGNER